MRISFPTLNDFVQMGMIYNQAIKYFDESGKGTCSKTACEITSQIVKGQEGIRNALCYKEQKNVLGFVMFQYKNNITWVNTLCVDPICQGENIEMELLLAVQTHSFECKMKLIAFETNPKAEWAVNFYLDNGYEIVNDKIEQYPYNLIQDIPTVLNRPIFSKLLG